MQSNQKKHLIIINAKSNFYELMEHNLLKRMYYSKLINKNKRCCFLFSLIQRFPSELSLESIGTSNNNTNDNTGSTIISNSSIHSSSSTSLDKISTTSNNSLHRHQPPQQQSNITKVNKYIFICLFINIYQRFLIYIILDHHQLPVF
jgi:hypothetical protein